MTSAPILEVEARGTLDGRARVCIGDREFLMQRRDQAGQATLPDLCPIEMVPVSLAA